MGCALERCRGPAAGVMLLALHSLAAAQGARCVYRDYLGHVATPGPPHGVAVRDGLACVAIDHTGIVTIDVSDPGAMKVLGQAPSNRDPTGVAMLDGYAFAASGIWLEVFDVRDPYAPTLVTQRSLQGVGQELDAWEQWLIVACGSSGAKTYDVSIPGNPRLASTFPTLAAADVHVADGTAYIADREGGLVMLDVTDPRAPVLAGVYRTEGGEVSHVWVEEGTAYLTTRGPGPSLEVVDVTDPALPVLVGSCDGVGGSSGVTAALAQICVADSMGMRVVDAALPQDPVLVGGYPVSEGALGVAIDPRHSTIAFVTGGEGNRAGMWAIDIAEPSAVPPGGTFDGYGRGEQVEIEGSLAFVATDGVGMHILDIADPHDPVPMSYYPAPTQDMDVVGTTAYLAAGARGLRLLDISDPAAPIEGPWYKPPGHGFSAGIIVLGGLVYLLDSYDHLYILRDSIAVGVPLLGVCELPAGDPYRMDLEGGLLCIAAGPAGLVTVDVSDPRRPHVASAFQTARAVDVAMEGGTAYVIDESWELAAISISDPAAPELLWTRPMRFNARYTPSGVTISGGTLCVVGKTALEMFDVSDRLDPRPVGVAAIGWAAADVEVRENLAFVCGRTFDLEIVDLSDCPPRPVGRR